MPTGLLMVFLPSIRLFILTVVVPVFSARCARILQATVILRLILHIHSMASILVALVLDMYRTRPGLVPTVPFLGQCPVFMGTQDRLQNVNHRSVTCPSWLLLPLHHLCGFLSCYSVRDISWMLTAGLIYFEPLGPSLCSPKALKSGPVSPGCGGWGPKA